MLSAKPAEVIFSNYRGLVILLYTQLLDKKSSLSPSHKHTSSFFFFLNIQTIPVPLLTLSHYCCSPTQSVPSTPYSTHSFPSMSDFSPEIDIAVQTWHGSKNFSRTQFLHTYCLHLSLLTSCLFLFFFFLNTPPKLLFIILCIAHELGTNFAKRN